MFASSKRVNFDKLDQTVTIVRTDLIIFHKKENDFALRYIFNGIYIFCKNAYNYSSNAIFSKFPKF